MSKTKEKLERIRQMLEEAEDGKREWLRLGNYARADREEHRAICLQWVLDMDWEESTPAERGKETK